MIEIDKLNQKKLNSLAEEYKRSESMQRDLETSRALLAKKPELYQFASDEVKADFIVASQCFDLDGRLIRFAPESARSNPMLARIAVDRFAYGYAFLIGEAARDKSIAISVAKSGGSALEGLPEEFLDDKEVALVAADKNPKNLKFFSERIRADEEICLLALSRDRTVWNCFADDAFKSDKVFAKVVLTDRGTIAPNSLSNDSPSGVFERIAEKGMTVNLSSQKIDLVSIDYEKARLVLEVASGNLPKKREILLRAIETDDKQTVELVCRKFATPPQTAKELLPVAAQGRKTRVLPFLMSYARTSAAPTRDERDRIIRGLRRGSKKAYELLEANVEKYAEDKEVVSLCSTTNGEILKKLGDSALKNDPSIISACAQSYVVKNADEPFCKGLNDVPFSYDDLTVLCKKDWRNLFQIDKKYLSDPVLCAAAVSSSEKTIELLSEEMKRHPLVERAKR